VFGTFAVTTIRVKDLDAMTRFYRDVLKFEVKKLGDEFSAFHTGNGGELVLWKNAAAPILPAFAGADLEAAREALADANPTEILEHPGGKHFYAYDPDGNVIGFADA
jgi:catechol 2,3-dioxygenase-like lactoylglutathione lyase family enzyme